MQNLLVDLSPDAIIINEQNASPDDWDSRVVPDDLLYFVEQTRIINGMPRLRLVANEFELISGEPFVTVAKSVKPPLHMITCSLTGNSEELNGLEGLCVRSPTELIDAALPGEQKAYFFFSEKLPAVSKSSFSSLANSCLNAPLEWITDTVACLARAINPEFPLHRKFLREAKSFPISSINGVDILGGQ